MQPNDDFTQRISKQIEERRVKRSAENEPEEPKKSTNDKGNGMPKTEETSSIKSSSGELVPTPPTASILQSNPLGVEILRSTNSIDSTVTDLRSYMRGLFANKPPAEIQRLDVFQVETAVSCAKTINELLKTKIEAIKIAKELV